MATNEHAKRHRYPDNLTNRFNGWRSRKKADTHLMQVSKILRSSRSLHAGLVVLTLVQPIALPVRAIQDCLPKRPIRHLEFQQQVLLVRLFTPHYAQCTHKVTFRVARGDIPSIDGDEDLLANERGCLASA